MTTSSTSTPKLQPENYDKPLTPKQASALWRFEVAHSQNAPNNWYKSACTRKQAHDIISLIHLKAPKDVADTIAVHNPNFKLATPIVKTETVEVVKTETVEVTKTVNITSDMGLAQVIETILPVAKGATHIQDLFNAKTPDIAKAKTSKKYYKPKIFDTVLHALKTPEINVLIKGPAGSGKSLMASELAQQLGLEFYAFSCSGSMRYGHVIGSDKLYVDPDTKQTVSKFELTELMSACQRPCLILLDECFSLAPDILIGLNGLFEPTNRAIETKGGTVKLHCDCKVVVAANSDGRNIDRNYAGARRVDGSTLDRFITFRVDYDTTVETNILNSLPKIHRDYIKDNFKKFRQAVKQNNILFDVSTRRLATCCKLVSGGLPCHEAFSAALLGQLSTTELKKTGFDNYDKLQEVL